MKFIFHFFDHLEDRVRGTLSHRSILYALVGGTATVLFWRGVWHTADLIEGTVEMDWSSWNTILMSGPGSYILGALILLITGLFVSEFIGERIIISGLKQEKKYSDKTFEEVAQEEKEIERINARLSKIEELLTDIKGR